MYANKLYANKIRRLVNKAGRTIGDRQAQVSWLRRHGGTSSAALIVVVVLGLATIGMLAAVALPAYQQYVLAASSARVHAHYEEAARYIDNEITRVSSEVAIGTQNLDAVEFPMTSESWVDNLNATGVTNPFGGAAYGPRADDQSGSVGIEVTGSISNETYSVTIVRPQFGDLADEPAEHVTLYWPTE